MLKNRRTSQTSKNKRVSQASKKQTQGAINKIVKWSLWMTFFMMICCVIAVAGGYYTYRHFSRDLPELSSLKEYHPPGITTVYSDDNRKIAEFYRERRIVTPLSEMPKMLIKAFVAAEDSRFFKHGGVDVISIVRAFLKNIEAGAVVQGGSTITQQVIKYFLLTSEKKYTRKIKEAILAYRIDKAFTKEEILFLYLNQIYLGHGAYGVEAAAENYFGKSVKDLSLAECAILAGLPKAPGKASPFNHPERAKERQRYVLKRMATEGYITQAQAEEAANSKLDIKPRRNWFIEKVPFYTEHVRRYVEEKYGRKALYEGGLKIYTAVNIEIQKAARAEVEKGLKALDRRHGYKETIKHLRPKEIEAFSKRLQRTFNKKGLKEGKIVKGVVTETNGPDKSRTMTVRMGDAEGILREADMPWSEHTLRVGDVIKVKIKGKTEKGDRWALALKQKPRVQGGLLCVEAGTGHVKAMVGGRDFRESQFNRAVQSRRQPGSAFKPIVYAAAIDKGYTPATQIIDNAMIYRDKYRKIWKPRNYGRRFHGPTLLRKALAASRNLATIKIMDDIGVGYTVKYAKKLGITSELYGDLSLALGSSGVSLLELVKAYSVFANLGELIEPVFITKIVDRDGNEIQETGFERQQVIERSTAYIMTSLLESVVKHGTGARVRALGRPAAGKTGTTNNLHDAWFVGYTPGYVTGTWVGFDKERSLGRRETGGRAASPIWLGFMKKILKGKPIRSFKTPRGVVFSKIDAETGLLAVPGTKKTIFECFKAGTVPKKYAKSPDLVTDADQFFKGDM
ncbi:PBP1A family penicillin-binding protein [Desulfobacterales bacterium HSG2]|nr:PBP1A family penicillin-binding protein [Desulfobacterales bacterium HSG2]